MKKYIFLTITALVGSPLLAQQQIPSVTVSQPPVLASPSMEEIVLSPNTEIVVTPNDTLSSKSLKEGAKFTISTVFDVMQDGIVLIPKGTVGQGTVTWRTGKGAFGKSGKMEIEFNYLELGGRKIPLSGKHRQEGEGNTGAAVGAVVVAGVFGAFVTGRSATIINGQQLRAHTVEPISFTIPANSNRVMTATIQAPPPVATPVPQVQATPSPAPAGN